MEGKTHAITGGLIVAATMVTQGPITLSNLGLVAIGTVAAMLPDIDKTNTKITHLITRNKSENPIIQIILKIGILLIMGLIFSVFVFKNQYALILGAFLAILSITPHRTVTHMILTPVLIMWLVFMIDKSNSLVFHINSNPDTIIELLKSIWNTPLVKVIGIGYCVHLFEDMLTADGVPILFPLYLKNIRIPIVTTKITEFVFLIVVAVFCLGKIFAF